MMDRSVEGDTQGASYEVGRSEDVLVERPASVEEEGPRRSSRRREDPSPEVPAVPNDEGSGAAEGSAAQKPANSDDHRQVMGRLTVRELEMLPKMEEIAKLRPKIPRKLIRGINFLRTRRNMIIREVADGLRRSDFVEWGAA